MVTFNGADEFFETAAEGGNAFRLTDIDGIGPATKDKIMAVREINNTQDVQDMSADELADKANISRSRASKAISGLGGNPSVSKRNKSTGTVSAAGMKTAQGDFMVGFSEMDKARAKNDARSRSKEAVRTDDRKRAPVTTDFDKWKNNKSRFDFPGVDTPRQEPNLLPKDVKQDEKPETTDFEARDERIKERKEMSYPRKEKDGRVLQLEGNRIPAWQVNKNAPSGTIPGVAPSDFEEEPDTPGKDVMGAIPSATRLSQSARDGLADGVQADMAFMDAEEGRRQEQDTVEETHGAVMDFLEGGSQREFEARMQDMI